MTTTFKTLIDLVQKFPDEKSCHLYLAAQRWETGEVICPFDNCGHGICYVFKDGIRYKCKKCKKIFTVKTGSFMEASKLPTIKWILAMYLINHTKGISSVQLAKDIGITQKSAWFVLQRIRTALYNDTPEERMDGEVEIDEAFVGGKNKNRHYRKRMQYKQDIGRTWPDKAPVFGMFERSTGRIRATALDSKTFANIGLAIVRNIHIGATLMTDDWDGYIRIEGLFHRKKVDHRKKMYVDGDVTTNRVENFWSHFKRGLHGTYIHVTPKHLDKYVQEFVYRFNSRNLAPQQKIERIVRNMVCRLKYKDLIAA